MAIAYFGSGSGSGAGATTLSITTPASIPAGAIIIVTAGGFCTSATPTLSGSGWTNLYSSSNVSSAGHWVWWKIAAGGEGTITMTTDGTGFFGEGSSIVFSGINTSSPIVSSGHDAWGGVSHGTVTSPSVNNTGTSSAAAVFMGAFYNGGSGTGQSNPTNMTSALVTGANNSSMFNFYRLNAPTGSQSYSTTASGGQIDWYGGDVLIFLAPAATGVSASAGKADVTASALAPTVTRTISASAGDAAATASANGCTVALGVPAGSAPVVGSALAPAGFTLAAFASPDVADGTTAAGALASAAQDVQVDADVAEATVDGRDIEFLPSAEADAGTADATIDAQGPDVLSSGTSALPGVAVTSAVARDPGLGTVAHPTTARVVADVRQPPSHVYADVATVDASIGDVIGQVDLPVGAGSAASTADAPDSSSQTQLIVYADVASVIVSIDDAGIASSTHPAAGLASVSIQARQPGLGIGKGNASTVVAGASAYNATGHASGGSANTSRIIRLAGSLERTYQIPHETRIVKVART